MTVIARYWANHLAGSCRQYARRTFSMGSHILLSKLVSAGLNW
jgi:hypothetical protein